MAEATILYKTNKRVLRKVGVLSAAKVLAALYTILGVIYGVIYGLMLMAFSVIGSASAGAGGQEFAELAALGIGGGIAASLGVLICTPILFAVLGFIAGAIMAAVYNFTTRFTGGLELEVE